MIILVLSLVGGLLALYLGACLLLYRRLFVPDRPVAQDDFSFTPWEFQAEYEEVDLVTADGVTFGAWFLRQAGSPQVIVVSPGHKGRRQSVLGVAIALWRKGFNVIAYSYRGMPGSDRAPITMGVRETLELQAAIDFARRRVKDARVGLLGYSMGAAVSLLGAAGEPSVEALVLDSPYSDLRRLLKDVVRRFSLLPGMPFVLLVSTLVRLRTGARLADCNALGVLSALEPRPLFFIHGGADRVTPVSHSRRLYDAYRGPREIWIVQGVGHCGVYFADRGLYVERVAGFFSRHLGLSRAQLRLVEDEEDVG